jgi:hypothetical protein
MGILEFEYNSHFADLVLFLSSLSYLSLTPDNKIYITTTQESKLDELGFFVFVVVVYSNFYTKMVICKNQDSFNDKCLVFFPKDKLYQVFKLKQDNIIYDLPKKEKLLTDFEKSILRKNLKEFYRKLELPANIRSWSKLYWLIKQDQRYICALGGNGIIINIESAVVDTLLKDFPSWETSEISKLLDLYLTILKASVYSDSGLYFSNSKIIKPFISYELDSFYCKTKSIPLASANGPEDFDRLIVTETTACGDLKNLCLEINDFFEFGRIKNQSIKSVKINDTEYVPNTDHYNTSFRNKLITWLAFSNIGIEKFCYILLLLKFGLGDTKFNTIESTASTQYCLSNSKNLKVVELDVRGDKSFFEKAILGKEVTRYKLWLVYHRLIRNYNL